MQNFVRLMVYIKFKKGGNIMEEIWKDIKDYERTIPGIKSW